MPTQAAYQEALSPPKISLYCEIPWGRLCQRMKAEATSEQSPTPDMQAFCTLILSDRRGYLPIPEPVIFDGFHQNLK
ncbi:MAG: hypothetical protein KME16_26295 [Scytolyngbya sp. HA4215-MV1]|nr:hypothetical protein [Scytolyngbya sp. HA4215-MV1]